MCHFSFCPRCCCRLWKIKEIFLFSSSPLFAAILAGARVRMSEFTRSSYFSVSYTKTMAPCLCLFKAMSFLFSVVKDSKAPAKKKRKSSEDASKRHFRHYKFIFGVTRKPFCMRAIIRLPVCASLYVPTVAERLPWLRQSGGGCCVAMATTRPWPFRSLDPKEIRFLSDGRRRI